MRRSPIAPVTYALIAINAVVFLICLIYGNSATVCIAANRQTVFVNGEVWRLITSMFTHFSAGHILFNCLSLYIFGQRAEAAYGSGRFAAIYFASGIVGALAGVIVYPGLSGGASGAIFGIGAAIAVYTKKRGPVLGVDFNVCAVLLAGNLIGGFATSGVANAAHIAGGVCGAVLGMAFSRRRLRQSS